MEVTRSNFEQVMPEFEEAVRNASFISIDAEFTGLNLGTTDNFSLFDSMNDRYEKLKTRASSFTISQIGISAFTKHPIENSYKVKNYVFYVRPYLCGSIDKRFMCQASCLDFLCRFDFDFNKFIKEGIPFINDDEEEQLCKEIEEGSILYPYDLLKREEDMLINDEFLGVIEQSRLDDLDEDDTNGCPVYQGKKIMIPKDNLYPEYFQLNQIRNKYPSLWAYVEGDTIIVEEVSAKQRRELQVACYEEREKVLNFFLGFTRVFRLLQEAKKPIVGHNVTMDLLLFYHNFYKPLPDKYKTFKKELHSIFPVIYDTRHMWRHAKRRMIHMLLYPEILMENWRYGWRHGTEHLKLKDIPRLCGLFELYEMFKRPPDALSTLYMPTIELTEGNKYAEGDFPHEAGYDSYVTGWIFLHICHLVAMKNVKSPLFIEPQTFKQHLNAVLPFVNKVNLSRSRFNFIDFAGNDPPPNVSEMLHVCRRSNKHLNQAELSRIFGKYGLVDIKLMSNKRQAVIIVGALGSFKDILRDFKDDKELDVSKYSMLRHSPYLKNSLSWCLAVGSSVLIGFLIMKL